MAVIDSNLIFLGFIIPSVQTYITNKTIKYLN